MRQIHHRRDDVQRASRMTTVWRCGVAGLVLFMLLTPVFAQGEATPRPLTLEESVTLALQHHPALREAGSRTTAAQASIDRTRAAQQVQLKADSRYTTVSEVPTITSAGGMPMVLGHDTTWLTTLMAQKVIYSGGRLEALTRQATSAAQATEIMQARTRQQVIFGVERAFFLLLAAQQEREVAQQGLRTAEDHCAVTRARYAARAAAQFDVLRADVQVEEAQQQVIQAVGNIQAAHAALLQALGVNEGVFIAVGATKPTSAPLPTLEKLQQQATAMRPELRAVDWQIRAAESAISAARAERRPTVSLLAEYQLVSPESPLLLTRWSIGIAMSLPLLDGGATRAKQQEATAQHDEIQATQEGLQQAIVAEVTQSYAQLLSAQAQISVANKRVEQSEEMLRIATVRYQEGVGTATEIADAQTVLTHARQGVVQACAQSSIAEAELRLAAGTVGILTSRVPQEELP